MIDVENLVFEYPTKRALHGVSLHVAPGAIAALVGPNGAGKTTLMRCIAALERPYSGRIRIDGIDVTARPREIHARLGLLPDFYGLYDDLTVARALHFAARAHGLAPGAVSAAVERAARRVGLADRLGERAATLSRGLRQRLGIAQAIVHEPRVLLLDEPASGLDPEARRHLSALLRELRDGGMTLVVSSHILSELEDYSSEMIIMEDGRIVGGEARRLDARQSDRLALSLAAAHADLEAFLVRQPGVGDVQASAEGAQFSLSGGAGEHHRLLKVLIDAGFPVCAYGAVKRRLQDLYFEEVDASRRPQ